MSTTVRKYPALSLFVLAMIFGSAPLIAINAGLLPESADQLGAFSASLAAVMHGAVIAWNGYIDVYRGTFDRILTYMALSVIVSIIIVLLAGATNLSRTNKRNVLEPERMSPEEAASPVGI